MESKSKNIFGIVLICLTFFCNSCREKVILTVSPNKYVFELGSSQYYIDKIEILEDGYKIRYKVICNNRTGKSKINLLNLPKQYTSNGNFDILDSNNSEFEVNLYAVNIEMKDSIYFTFKFPSKGNTSFEVSPFTLSP